MSKKAAAATTTTTPVRHQYVHTPCKGKAGAIMTLGQTAAEEMAKNPHNGLPFFMTADKAPTAVCPVCATPDQPTHPIGEFTWVEDGAVLGT